MEVVVVGGSWCVSRRHQEVVVCALANNVWYVCGVGDRELSRPNNNMENSSSLVVVVKDRIPSLWF